MDSLFDHVENKLKSLAKVAFVIFTILGSAVLIGSLTFLADGSNSNVMIGTIALVFGIVLVVFGIIAAWYIYAFGELLEHTKAIHRLMPSSQPSLLQPVQPQASPQIKAVVPPSTRQGAKIQAPTDPVKHPPAPAKDAPVKDVASELRTMKAKLDAGEITQEEFDAIKEALDYFAQNK